MINPAHVQVMARYNRWQNRSIYAAADTLMTPYAGAARSVLRLHPRHAQPRALGGQSLDAPACGWPARTVKSIAESLVYVESWDELKRERQSPMMRLSIGLSI